MMKFCVYYNQYSLEIQDILPQNIPASIRSRIFSNWDQDISRKVLMLLSMHEKMTAPQIKEKIGHSMSTLHEVIKRLEDDGLISTEMVYSGKKQKMIVPNVLCVTKNPKYRTLFQKFFRGIWVDSLKSRQILDVLESEPDKFFTAEDISLKSGIPVDEVQLLLDNWDSQATRALSQFLKPIPFEKKIMYRSK